MIEAKGPDIIVGDFNIDAYQESGYHIYWQGIRNLLTLQHILQDHVYVKNGLQENNDIKVSVLNIYFSDHDAARVQISKKNKMSVS